MVKRWLIRANGKTVGYEYESIEKAWKRANAFREHCNYQDEPWDPVMTILEQTISEDDEWI